MLDEDAQYLSDDLHIRYNVFCIFDNNMSLGQVLISKFYFNCEGDLPIRSLLLKFYLEILPFRVRKSLGNITVLMNAYHLTRNNEGWSIPFSIFQVARNDRIRSFVRTKLWNSYFGMGLKSTLTDL